MFFWLQPEEKKQTKRIVIKQELKLQKLRNMSNLVPVFTYLCTVIMSKFLVLIVDFEEVKIIPSNAADPIFKK